MRYRKHCELSLATLVAGLIGAGAGCAPGGKERGPFRVVLLPDTQNYSEKFPDTYVAQTRWIRERAEADNIRFVIHLGDIVQNYNVEKQWQVADRAHQVLDGAVPYSVVPGNHDLDRENKQFTYNTSLYDKYFPPSRFEKCPWYGGHAGSTNANNYCFFEGAGMKFLVLSLEFAPRDSTLAWAGEVIRSHPEHRVIVATHYYMRTDGRGKGRQYGLEGSIGEELWNKFVRKHDSIFLVVSGHVVGVGHQTSVNDAGGKVREILCDYQGLPNGGDGWLEILRFVPQEKAIHVEAYSPLLNQYNRDPAHTYTLEWNISPAKGRKAA